MIKNEIKKRVPKELQKIQSNYTIRLHLSLNFKTPNMVYKLTA